jgi:hypothetical protein
VTAQAKWDLIVVGAGPAGVAAAIAAARRGCKVLLIERHGFAGGMATAALVNPFLGNYYRNPDTGRDGSIIHGIFEEVEERLKTRHALLRFRYGGEDSPFSDAFDDAYLRGVYDDMLREAKVEILFHACMAAVSASKDGHLDAVVVTTKSGMQGLYANAFIDCTGDADVAALCGVPCDVGRDQDGLCQPTSTMFRMGGVDKAKLLAGTLREARATINQRFSEAKAAGRVYAPNMDGLGVYEFPRPGVIHFNATRMLGGPALTSEEMTKAEIEGRRQTQALCEWLKAEVPEFKNAFVESIATQIGVRETRRVRGRYRMAQRDIVEGERFQDGIARSAYFIDIHSPTGAGNPHAEPGKPGIVRAEFKPKRYYEIPFRCLVPEGMKNLLVACRAISTTFEAHAATRVMATMHAVGEAAGIAAGLARKTGIPLCDVDGRDVRHEIAYLDRPLGF